MRRCFLLIKLYVTVFSVVCSPIISVQVVVIIYALSVLCVSVPVRAKNEQAAAQLPQR